MNEQAKSTTVLVLYTGGQFLPMQQHLMHDRWLHDFLVWGLVTFADTAFVTRDPFPRGTQHLLQTAKRIQDDWRKYHGFVVILERTAFLFYAALLSFMLGDVSKPIVFTCPPGDSMDAERERYSNINVRASVVNAALAACGKQAGTLMIVGSELISSTHATFFQNFDDVSEHLVEDIIAADNAHAGRIDFGLQEGKKACSGRKNFLDLYLAHAADIPVLHYEDYLDLRALLAVLPQDAMVKSRTATDLSREQLLAKTTLLLLEPDALSLFSNGAWTPITWMTPETAMAKFVWLHGQRSDQRFVKEYGADIVHLMRRDFIGETLRRRS